MRFLLTALAALLATPALACEPPVIAIDAEGNARWVDGSPATRGAAEAYAGPAPSARHILVIDEGRSTAEWIRPDTTPTEIAIGYGINSYVYVGSARCAPPGMPGSLDDLPDDPPPEELFADALPCTGGPRDGIWTAEIGPTQIEGCPAMMQQAFGQMALAGALPKAADGAPGRLAFACPFHPDTLELSRTARVHWQAEGPNHWSTTDLAAEHFAHIPAGEGAGSQIRWELTVVSPEEISFRRSVEIVLPATAAAVMGITADGCRIVGTDRWVRTGD